MNQTQPLNGFARLDSMLAKNEGQIEALHINGYADFVFLPDYNNALSQQRADVVKTYIIKKAVSGIRIIQSQGRGETASTNNGSPLGQPLQRRVDVVCTRIQVKDTRPPIAGTKKLGESETHTESKENEEPENETEQTNASSELPELKKGKSLTLEGLSFEPGRHVLLKSSIPVLEKLCKTLRENPGLKIEIQGHVCCADGGLDGLDYDTYERNLSYSRAKAVYDYLVYKGIKGSRLSYKGFGHTQPKVSPELSKADEQANRRVEILVVEE